MGKLSHPFALGDQAISLSCMIVSSAVRITSLACSAMDFGFSGQNPVLSTLPDNPGYSRFWTLSPGLQIRV